MTERTFKKLDRIVMAIVWIITATLWAGVIWLFIQWRRLEGEA